MQVKELIKELSKFNQELEVVIPIRGENEFTFEIAIKQEKIMAASLEPCIILDSED